MALEVYDETTIAENAFARILLLGPAKAGKTTCITTTAPLPFVINCDGASATKGAAALGGKFKAVNVESKADWQAACAMAVKLADQGEIKTVVVDTISLLSDTILEDLKLQFTGWDLWRELEASLMRGIKQLMQAPAHLFINAHMSPDFDASAGTLPSIGGKAKIKIPALLDDWVLLDVEGGRKPHERVFLLGPQKTWNHSGRNIKRTTQCEATVPALFAELGIAL